MPQASLGSQLGLVSVTISEACRISGLSRSEVYRRLAAGDISAVKSGKKTLVLASSLRGHIESLPAARFGAPPPQVTSK